MTNPLLLLSSFPRDASRSFDRSAQLATAFAPFLACGVFTRHSSAGDVDELRVRCSAAKLRVVVGPPPLPSWRSHPCEKTPAGSANGIDATCYVGLCCS